MFVTETMRKTAILICTLRQQGLRYKEIDMWFLPEGWRSYHIARHSWARREVAAYMASR